MDSDFECGNQETEGNGIGSEGVNLELENAGTDGKLRDGCFNVEVRKRPGENRMRMNGTDRIPVVSELQIDLFCSGPIPFPSVS